MKKRTTSKKSTVKCYKIKSKLKWKLFRERIWACHMQTGRIRPELGFSSPILDARRQWWGPLYLGRKSEENRIKIFFDMSTFQKFTYNELFLQKLLGYMLQWVHQDRGRHQTGK